ncbi:MAG TPA: Crp/Fnr family transcriptional regulator [Mucilaginibacter sp.]
MDHNTLRVYTTPILELTDDELSLLINCMQRRELKKGELLLAAGEVCRTFYLVEQGYLRTWYDKDGVQINLHFTFEGESTSNLKSFLHKQSSEVNIEAGEDAVVSVFHVSSVAEKFGEYPNIMRFIRRLALRLLVASEEYSDLFKVSTPTERYRYIEKNNPRLLQRISLSQMASYLGVTRETLSRIRGKK